MYLYSELLKYHSSFRYLLLLPCLIINQCYGVLEQTMFFTRFAEQARPLAPISIQNKCGLI